MFQDGMLKEQNQLSSCISSTLLRELLIGAGAFLHYGVPKQMVLSFLIILFIHGWAQQDRVGEEWGGDWLREESRLRLGRKQFWYDSI